MNYSKPLKNGGSRIIPRSGAGRFSRATLDAAVCASCGAINIPTIIDERDTGGFTRKVLPEQCHRCGTLLRQER